MTQPVAESPTVAQYVPASVVPTVAVPPTERKVIVTVHFDFDDYKVRTDALPVLSNLAAALKDERLRGVSYEVNGHTDARGKLPYNVALSMLRAKAVVDYLRDNGVLIPPIRAQGFGPLELLFPSDPLNPENRRVEIVATGP